MESLVLVAFALNVFGSLHCAGKEVVKIDSPLGCSINSTM